MKNVRIEYHITAFVHVGEGVDEGLPPENTPLYMEEITVKRVAPLNDSFLAGSESGKIYATVKANAVSMIADMAGVLPEKLAHAARDFAR